MGCGASRKTNQQVQPAVAPAAAPAAAPAVSSTAAPAAAQVGHGQKLNVLCLHGTTMSGNSMRSMFRWKECAIEPTCQDIANFYYPTGPCVVSKKHPIWKAAPGSGPPGADKRHWYTMGNKWDFSSKAFEDARKVINKFVDEEVGGPIDVVCGYSQGASAVTQLLNDIFDGKNDRVNLKCIRGAIFLGCPENPKVSASVSNRVRSLHCNGDKDPLTGLSGAKKHAAQFKNDTFFEFDGTHAIRKPCADPFRRFLLTVQNGRETE